LKFDFLRVPSIHIPPKKSKNLEFLSKFPRRTNLMELLVTMMGSRN
jgi:hypothetical protein